jgi:hypothetical protein
MLTGTCHCGAIHIQVSERPQSLIDCNCSICRRYGALWALYEIGAVRVIGHPDNTVEYIWGQKKIKTMRCLSCGCVTHWEPLQPGRDNKLGVNMRNFDPRETEGVPTRRFDGADTWLYLD